MPMPGDAETMGKAFSQVDISHEDRIANISAIMKAARNLYSAIVAEIQAETLAQYNEPVDPTWADFRGNGVDGDPPIDGINNEVQDRGEELYEALAALPTPS